MKERPILWSAPMVLALLAGRKTQTRRLLKPQPEFTEPGTKWLHGNVGHSGPGWYAFHEDYPDEGSEHWPAYTDVGDRLWGRETFGATDLTLDDKHRPGIHYRATDDWPQRGPWPWRPSIFMPRWASRLLHEVTAVRVERLGEISEADALAEGIEAGQPPDPKFPQWRHRWPGGNTVYAGARAAYFAGWDTINGKGSAAKNPWVWVVSFKAVPPSCPKARDAGMERT